MPKPTTVATTEVAAQGAVIEASFDDGVTYSEIPGIESIPRVGVEGSFIEITSINDLTKRYIGGIKTPPEWELPFRRIGNDAVQDALIAAANNNDVVKVRVTYRSGDVADVDVVFNGFYADEASQGESIQMFATKGQQTGDAVFSKVA